MSTKPTVTCKYCGNAIPEIRLEALPGIATCVKCASKNPVRINPSSVEISQASTTARNGFAPSD